MRLFVLFSLSFLLTHNPVSGCSYVRYNNIRGCCLLMILAVPG